MRCRAVLVIGFVVLSLVAPVDARAAAPAPEVRGGVFDLWINDARRDSPVYAKLTGRFVVGGRNWIGTIRLNQDYQDLVDPFSAKGAGGVVFSGTCERDWTVFPEYAPVVGLPAGDLLRFECRGSVGSSPPADFVIVLGPGVGTLGGPPAHDDPQLLLARGVFRQPA